MLHLLLLGLDRSNKKKIGKERGKCQMVEVRKIEKEMSGAIKFLEALKEHKLI